jgi:hypothetical protein
LDAAGQSQSINYYDPLGPLLNDYPVKDNCPFQNAAMFYPFTRYATLGAAGTLPTGDAWEGSPALWNILTPDYANDANWRSVASFYNFDVLNSYELWASCRGTNIGAGLREANNALTDPVTNRSEGTVWVMIMLSDGAAGASDPARSSGGKIDPAFPYFSVGGPLPAQRYGIRGGYGTYGVCPYGRTSDFGEVVDTVGESPVEFPFCLDEEPETRHFCYPPVRAVDGGDSSVGDPSNDVGFGPGARDANYDYSLSSRENAALGNVFDVDVGFYPSGLDDGCLFYDVDDYARDWADFVGRVFEDSGDSATLPTIFTIGFGLNFAQGDGSCDANIPDCLGEELLRYIADVGDNFRIDTDYQQDYLDNDLLDDSLPADDYGLPGPCEPPGGGYAVPGDISSVQFLDPRENCGNYFNAPSEEELDIVFDEIASRMFTRLAG